MARAARSVHARKKRRKVLDQAKGYRGTKHTSYKRAKEQVWKSGVYAYEGRKQRKRDFRALWIQRINAGAREHGLSYSKFIHGLKLAEIDLDRKILADLAVTEPEIFAAIVAQAKNALDGKPVERRVEVERAVASAQPETPAARDGSSRRPGGGERHRGGRAQGRGARGGHLDRGRNGPGRARHRGGRGRGRRGRRVTAECRVPRRSLPKRAAKLKAKKYREAERLFLAEGARASGGGHRNPRCRFSMRRRRSFASRRSRPRPVRSGSSAFLDVAVPELLSRVQRIVLLHGVQDPGNVGTAIRSAHAFGAGIALSKGSADLYNPKTVRASMGSIFHAPVAREVESIEFLDAARDAGFATVAAMPDAGETPKSMPAGPLVVCIGAEGSGLPEDVVEACEMQGRPYLPLRPRLNASVAASILLYEAYSRVLP